MSSLRTDLPSPPNALPLSQRDPSTHPNIVFRFFETDPALCRRVDLPRHAPRVFDGFYSPGCLPHAAGNHVDGCRVDPAHGSRQHPPAIIMAKVGTSSTTRSAPHPAGAGCIFLCPRSQGGSTLQSRDDAATSSSPRPGCCAISSTVGCMHAVMHRNLIMNYILPACTWGACPVCPPGPPQCLIIVWYDVFVCSLCIAW